ncbi:MAG: hypothetical protein HY537_13940 [Deltaproteobacteria bacterium]|nr:hypothetical protein [Deltaproteobacteria bacterium]
MGWEKGSGLSFAVLCFVFATLAQGSIHGSITTFLGKNLSQDDDQASVTFEPSVTIGTKDNFTLTAYSLINRPFNGFENFSVPKTALWATLPIITDVLVLHPSATLLGLDEWKAEGYMARWGVGVETVCTRAPIRLSFRVTPFIQTNQFSQRNDGTDLPRYGFSERLNAMVSFWHIELLARLVMEQSYTGNWKNDYSIYEHAGYRMNERLLLGVSHELLSSVVDPTTGFYREFRVFDSRASRLSAFLQWVI